MFAAVITAYQDAERIRADHEPEPDGGAGGS